MAKKIRTTKKAALNKFETNFPSQHLTVDDLVVVPENLFQVTMAHALELGATSIHFEWHTAGFKIRFRLEHQLREVLVLNHDQSSELKRQVAEFFDYVIDNKALTRELVREYVHDSTQYLLTLVVLRVVQGERFVIHISSSPEVLASSYNLQDQGRDKLKNLAKQSGILFVNHKKTFARLALLSSLPVIFSDGRQVMLIGDFNEYPRGDYDYLPTRNEIGFTRAVALRSMLKSDYQVIILDQLLTIEELELVSACASIGKLVLCGLPTTDLKESFYYLWSFELDREFWLRSILGFLSVERPKKQDRLFLTPIKAQFKKKIRKDLKEFRLSELLDKTSGL